MAAQRSSAPDLARGVMLLLIAIANVSFYLWGHEAPMTSAHPLDGSAIDRALAAIAIVLVDARIYPMFAFLFGYGIVQFSRSRYARGVPEPAIRSMLFRRHWWLIAFGFVHALLLFAGDILGTYGIAGLILTAIFFSRSDTVLRITVWVLLGVLASGAVLMFGAAMLLGAAFPDLAGLADQGDAWQSNADFMNGVASFWLAMLIRVGVWIFSAPGAVFGLTIPAAILIGMLAGRHAWLETLSSRISLGAVALGGILIGAVGGILPALGYLGVSPLPDTAEWGTMGIAQVTGIAGGVGYVALFGLIGQRLSTPLSGVPRAIAAVGKRSLSCYLFQSVVFAPLLAAWGFGLGARINTTAAFGIALGVWLVSVILASLLERSGVRGPAEILLRRLTTGGLDRAAPAAPERQVG
ncbi:DUF418 domain-containing protein [Leucobacter tardus]|nr:DUF418 domain-containing protein [Leucobacter tardus]